MTKTKRNLTIYSGVILLFGLILMITLIIIYDQVSVTSKFNDDTLALGSFVVSDFEDEKNYTAFSVVNPDDFIERHIISHEHYLFRIHYTDLDAKYFIFQVGTSLFTLKYVEHEDMFYLFSGVFYVEHNQKTYAISYVEQQSDDLSEDIFKSYEDMKTYYMYIYNAIPSDALRVIRLTAYEIDLETNQINLDQSIDIILDYKDDEIVIEFP